MATKLIDDRGTVIGSRITVYNLLPHFLDATATEDFLCRLYDLTAEQVSAARAHVLNNLDTVLAQHLKIEARVAAGNPPEVIAQAERTRAAMKSFKQWLTERAETEASEHVTGSSASNGQKGEPSFPSFREWFAAREARATEGS